MATLEVSKRPGGIWAEITLTFLPGSGITTAVGSAVEAWVTSAAGAETQAASAIVTAADKMVVQWPNETLPKGKYRMEGFMTPPGGTEELVHESDIFVNDKPGP